MDLVEVRCSPPKPATVLGDFDVSMNLQCISHSQGPLSRNLMQLEDYILLRKIEIFSSWTIFKPRKRLR